MKTLQVNLTNFDEGVISEITKRTHPILRELDFETFPGPVMFNRPGVINRDLSRYYILLKITLKTVLKRFSFDEILTILNIMSSAILTTISGVGINQGTILLNIDDAVRFEEIDKKIGMTILPKLVDLTVLEEIALSDFIDLYRVQENCDSLEQFIEDFLA